MSESNIMSAEEVKALIAERDSLMSQISSMNTYGYRKVMEQKARMTPEAWSAYRSASNKRYRDKKAAARASASSPETSESSD